MKNHRYISFFLVLIIILSMSISYANPSQPTRILLSSNYIDAECPSYCNDGAWIPGTLEFEKDSVDCTSSHPIADCCQPTAGLDLCRLAKCGGCIVKIIPEVDASGSCYDYCANKVFEGTDFPNCMKTCYCVRNRLTYNQCNDVGVLIEEKWRQFLINNNLDPGLCQQEGNRCGYGNPAPELAGSVNMDTYCSNYLGRTVSGCALSTKYTCNLKGTSQET